MWIKGEWRFWEITKAKVRPQDGSVLYFNILISQGRRISKYTAHPLPITIMYPSSSPLSSPSFQNNFKSKYPILVSFNGFSKKSLQCL